MFPALISGFRSIRVSLVTGSIILISTYILLNDILFQKMAFRPVVTKLFSLSHWVPVILIISLSLVIGSLYTTLLEGIVDGFHRKYINLDIDTVGSRFKKSVYLAFLPYSFAAKRRLIGEVKGFYKENSQTDSAVTEENPEQKLINMVLIEVLWMEGKLSGTPMEQPYDRLRAEGEMRVAGGLLIPYASLAVAYALYADLTFMIIAFFLGIILAVPMINYGLYYFKKANSFLAHHIADGKILSPAMESLKRTASRLNPPAAITTTVENQ